MHKMGGGAEVFLQVRVLLHCRQDLRGAGIAVFANEGIHAGVLAELFQSRRENDQLPPVGDGHAGAIDGLVAQPGGFEFGGIEIDHHLVEGLLEHLKVDLEREFAGTLETLLIVADEEAAHDQLARSAPPDHGQDVEDGHPAGEVKRAVVEGIAHGIVRAPHDALHAVDGADVMALVDPFGTAGADENVLVVAGHARHLMRHHLTDGEDQIMLAAREVFRDLHRPVIVHPLLRDLTDIVAGDDPEGLETPAKIVDTEKTALYPREHGSDFGIAHGFVGAQGREHIGHVRAVIVPGQAGQFPGPRVKAGEIGGKGDDAAARAQFVEGAVEPLAQGLAVEHIGDGSSGK